MRWLTLTAVLLYLARSNDAGALKCHPGSHEPQCTLEKKEISPVQNLIERDMETDLDDTQCLSGSEWESNCHRCRCSDSGFAECTKLYSCVAEKHADPIPCKPNTTFRRAGNLCTCLENGLGLCTQSRPIEKRRKKKRDIQKEIPDVLRVTDPRIKRSVCKPHSEFNVDCNPCKCTADGLSYTCTHNECLEGGEPDNTNKDVEVFMETEGTDHIEQHSVCKPRATFYVSCNTCRCNTYGSSYSCTDKPCPLPADVELFHELKAISKLSDNTKVVCVANRMFIKDCNTCWCNEDGTSYFCTRRVCSDMPDGAEEQEQELKLRVVKRGCRPNEVFEMDCNMCRCNPDGMSYSCTRRACLETDKKNATSRSVRAITEPPKTCQPGQEFRLDCNKCLCNDEGQDYSCTRIDCAALNTGAETRRKRDTTAKMPVECVPGSVFDRDCNVCRCSDDGHFATCTVKSCKKNLDVTTESSSSFRCTPGDQFKRSCNDCTCSADGKNVFCSLRLCDHDLGEI